MIWQKVTAVVVRVRRSSAHPGLPQTNNGISAQVYRLGDLRATPRTLVRGRFDFHLTKISLRFTTVLTQRGRLARHHLNADRY